ncbi:MAG: DUF2703 domain-containing protein [Gemmatimonadaceae bacterium]|nr:DUF2703 domain-containing protein [Gemmatimonadaceae bacterium]
MTTPASTTPLAEPAIARSLNVELLALDLNTCTRCTGSRASIDAALALVKPVLDAAGIKSRVHLRVIETEEQARQYRFVASPTIRVNGLDIAPALHESHCDSCTELCGCAGGTSCREWHYRGETHDKAPTGLIVEALMRAAFGERTTERLSAVQGDAGSEVPDNLKRFFAGTAHTAKAAACCEPAVQETCCDPVEKASCCGIAVGQKCGCQ